MDRSNFDKWRKVICLGILCLFLSVEFVRSEGLKEYKLTLQEVSQLAFDNNFEIQLAKYDVWMARTDQGVAESVYDTIFDAQISHRDDEAKRTTTILGTQIIDTDYNVGLTKKLPTGTTVEAEFLNNRNKSDSVFASSSELYESSGRLSITQELGKNFFGLLDRGEIKLTLIDIENAEYISIENIEEDISFIRKAYWDLVLTKELLDIEKGILEQARALYQLHQDKLQDGLVELPEAIASEANYKERLNEVMLAENSYQEKINLLKLQLNLSEEALIITPVDKFDVFKENQDLIDSLKLAVEYRNDYKLKKNIIKAKKLELSMKKNSLWPEINIKASMRRNGLGDGFDDSMSNIFDEDNPDFTAQLNVTVPIENTKARAQFKRAKLDDARALLDLKYIERKISVEIEDVVRNCNVLKEVAQSNIHIARLQESKLEEEQKRFRYGRSDTDTIIRYQEDSLRAKRLSALAQNAYHHALVDLKKAQGVLLKDYWEGEF